MIGDKIRELRKARKLTQEQLAEYLNISPQAVSKWETGASIPDLYMLQRLAVFFRTTPDALLDFDRQRIDEEVKALVKDSCPLTGDPKEREAYYRELLKKYPNNDLLLNYLLMVLPNSRFREKIEIGERLLDTSSDESIRLDVLRLLAQTCHNVGEQAMAENYLRQMPEYDYLKTEIGAVILDGEAQLREIEKTEDMCLCTLCVMLMLRQRRTEDGGERARLKRLLDELLALFSRDPVYRDMAVAVTDLVKTGSILSSYQ